MDILGWNIPIWLILLLIVITAWYWKATAQFGTFRKLGIPGPRPIPVLGTMYTLMRSKRGMLDGHQSLHKKYKSDLIGTFMGSTPSLVIFDIEAAKQIMVKDFNNFEDHQVFDMHDSILNRILTMLEGDHWRVVRQRVSPAFSGSKLRKMMGLINQCGQLLVKNLQVPAKAGDIFECKDYLGSYTMDVIGRTSFSLDVDCQNDKNNVYVRAAKTLTEEQSLLHYRTLILLMVPGLIPYLVKYCGYSALNPVCVNFFTNIVEKSMQDRADHPEEAPKDLLQMIMASEVQDDHAKTSDSEMRTDRTGKWSPNGLVKDDILAICFTFFFAGYSTVADTLSFTVYHLALYPDVQEKAYQEIMQVLPDGEDPDYEQMKKLTYLQMCIDETLRIYPPGPFTDRRCKADTVVNGHAIPKDMHVAIPIHAFQNDPEVWDDPDKFDPERFTEEAKEARHPFQYMPFGAGPRNCVAQRLALVMAKIALVHVVRAYKLSKCDKTEIPLKMHHSRIESMNGIWLNLEERS